MASEEDGKEGCMGKCVVWWWRMGKKGATCIGKMGNRKSSLLKLIRWIPQVLGIVSRWVCGWLGSWLACAWCCFGWQLVWVSHCFSNWIAQVWFQIIAGLFSIILLWLFGCVWIWEHNKLKGCIGSCCLLNLLGLWKCMELKLRNVIEFFATTCIVTQFLVY